MLAAICLAAVAAADSPRVDIDFDAGWSFYRAQDEEKTLPADAKWRPVDLPHDFQIEDRPKPKPEPKGMKPPMDVTAGPWAFSLGDDMAWAKPEFDHTGWKMIQGVGGWSVVLGDNHSNSYGWYRRHLSLSPGKDVKISLGRIDDCDEAYVNGVKIGQTGTFPPQYETAWDADRVYTVPAGLIKGGGKDLLAVRVYNGAGEGGLYSGPSNLKRQVVGPFDTHAKDGQATGYTVGGFGWYRKTFRAPAAWLGRRVEVRFDGVYMRSKVWLNGRLLAEHPYGYTPFNVVLDGLKTNEDNTLQVEVDSTASNSRWYTGSGIYRQVRLVVTEPLHLKTWGSRVDTVDLSSDDATMLVRTTVANDMSVPSEAKLVRRILAPNGLVVWTSEAGLTVPAKSEHTEKASFRLSAPLLWTPDSPNLYRLVSQLKYGDKTIDEATTTFGVRTVAVTAATGLLLNGNPVDLHGGCVHHDNGPLGAVSVPRAEERRVQIMKSCGYNAIRTSHNPPSAALLDACDKLGMLVLEEAFDNWHRQKGSNYNLYFDKWWQRDLDAMIGRDANRPSVIMWSVGNEIPEQADEDGAKTAKMLGDYFKDQDPYRPVTMAAFPMGDGWRALEKTYSSLDVQGLNYMAEQFDAIHAEHPDRILMTTESQSMNMFHGLMQVRDHKYVIGDFIWTAWDYLGEIGVGRVIRPGEASGFFGTFPYIATGSGEIDLVGRRKPQTYYRQILFGGKDIVAAFVEPAEAKYQVSGWGWYDDHESWTWPGLGGKPMNVRVYSSFPSVKLLLNGMEVGTAKTGREEKYMARFTVPYQPGKLEAVGLDSAGTEAKRWTLESSGAPARLDIAVDRSTLSADGHDLSYVSVTVVDSQGRRVPYAENTVTFDVSGPVSLAGVGNGSPTDANSYQSKTHVAWQGRVTGILRTGSKAGKVTVKATAKGLGSVSATLTVK
ncbi:MAG: DUF4982 domain-containing protein [Armatimonadetes bacterium]|nr:DUF4982 domain-containing protein [Armatimonadota bacterium]